MNSIHRQLSFDMKWQSNSKCELEERKDLNNIIPLRIPNLLFRYLKFYKQYVYIIDKIDII